MQLWLSKVPFIRSSLTLIPSSFFNRVADAEWDTNATDYNHTFVLDGSSPAQHLFGEEDNFISRLTGFFVPPRTGEYEFLVRGDDVGELWGSLLGPSNLVGKFPLMEWVALFDVCLIWWTVFIWEK